MDKALMTTHKKNCYVNLFVGFPFICKKYKRVPNNLIKVPESHYSYLFIDNRYMTFLILVYTFMNHYKKYYENL